MQITNEGLAHLSTLTNLQKIYLNNNQISNEGLAHLSTLTNLQYISLDDNQISNEGLISFVKQSAKLINLKVLYLRNNKVSG